MLGYCLRISSQMKLGLVEVCVTQLLDVNLQSHRECERALRDELESDHCGEAG